MKLDFQAGHQALDFVNTAYGTGDRAVDRLRSFSDLVDWLEDAKLVDAAASRRLARQSASQREAMIRDARAMRGALRVLFDRLAGGKSIRTEDVAFINERLQDVRLRCALNARGSHFSRELRPVVEESGEIPSALAWLAADLLESNQQIRSCANHEGCTLLFVDTTKNHTRIWCSVKTCGNRAKVAAFRARQ